MESIQGWIETVTQTYTIMDVVIAIAIILLAIGLSVPIATLGEKLFHWNHKPKKQEKKQSPFYKPLKGAVILVGIYAAILVMHPSKEVVAFGTTAFRIGIIWAVAIGVANLLDPKNKLFSMFQKQKTLQTNETLTKFTGKIVKVIVYVIAAFLSIAELGYDITGVITGLGLGGVVLALAAQDLAKSLFGGFIILIDKPFLVGDWIKVLEYEGTVEDITFRSTRIRTLDNMEVVVQNAYMAEASIMNYSRMGKRRYALQFLLPLETPSSTIQQVMKRIRLVLQTNPNLLPDQIEVHYSRIDATGIQIEVSVYTTVVSMYPYFGVRDEVNNMVLNILESENLHMSYTGQNVYVNP